MSCSRFYLNGPITNSHKVFSMERISLNSSNGTIMSATINTVLGTDFNLLLRSLVDSQDRTLFSTDQIFSWLVMIRGFSTIQNLTPASGTYSIPVPPTTLTLPSGPSGPSSSSVQSVGSSSFLVSHQSIFPSVEVVTNSLPVLLESQQRSTTGS